MFKWGDSEALATAARLEAMGVEVRSAELVEAVEERRAFVLRGGNRATRRAAARAAKRARRAA